MSNIPVGGIDDETGIFSHAAFNDDEKSKIIIHEKINGTDHEIVARPYFCGVS